MPDENNTSQKGKSGVLASVRASVGALSLSGQPGQREKTWKLWKDHFVRATRWMAVNDNGKLDFLWLVGGKELQKLLQTLPEQSFQHWINISKRIVTTLWSCTRKWFNTEWSPDIHFGDFEVKCREQALHCDFLITLDNAIIRMTVLKTSDVKLFIRKTGDLKSVRETVKAFEIASEGSQMMKSGEEVNSQETGDPELKRVSTPGRYLVKSQGDTALLSRGAAERMGLVEYFLDLTLSTPLPVMGKTRQETVYLVEEYNDAFSGLGKLRGVKVKLHLDPDAKGAVQKQRRVTPPLKDKFDEILDKWEEMDIIEDVRNEPTEWCSNAVLTPKKDGENIKASLDLTDANKYIKRTRHAIPTLRELETRLNGAKYFSHLDMNDGYMQLELAGESRKLTTFYTHRGLKRFKRLHFGVNSAAEIFNEEVRMQGRSTRAKCCQHLWWHTGLQYNARVTWRSTQAYIKAVARARAHDHT